MLAILMLSACKTTTKIVEVPVEVVKNIKMVNEQKMIGWVGGMVVYFVISILFGGGRGVRCNLGNGNLLGGGGFEPCGVYRRDAGD